MQCVCVFHMAGVDLHVAVIFLSCGVSGRRANGAFPLFPSWGTRRLLNSIALDCLVWRRFQVSGMTMQQLPQAQQGEINWPDAAAWQALANSSTADQSRVSPS
jgi:hypothetical protein